MKKRYLALLCFVALVLSVFALNIKAEAATNYLVGYSIKDINPWLDPNDHSKGIIQGITMKGQGSNDLTRYATWIHDDDGDGNVKYTHDGTDENICTLNSWTPDADGGDGIYATCIAITDSKGKTVLFVTIDALGAYSGLLSDSRTAIQNALGADVIKKDDIIMSGSHTHSSFGFNDEKFRGEDAEFGEYYDYVVSQIAASAVEAYADRASATMSKGSRDAGTVAQDNGTRYQLNFIRHYQRDAYDAWDYDTNGKKVTFAQPYEISFVQGSNFGTIAGLRRYIEMNESTSTSKIPNQPYHDSNLGKTVGVVFDTVNNVNGYQASHLAVADDMMHLIKFDFGTNSSKKPILMLNWRAHTTENGGDFRGAVSSDYVGPLRAMLKKDGYRMSFFLGGAGDLIINQFNSNSPENTPWRNTIKKNSSGVATESDTNAYGRCLYNVAKACLKDNMSTKTPGDILVSVSNYTYNRQVDSEGMRAALAAIMEEHPDDYNTNWDHYPYSYKHTDGKTYIINSYHHANGIKGRLENVASDTYPMSITAVTLGNGAAFVTAPFELADRYDSVNPLDNSLNDWLDLGNKGGFGTPFVLSCSNGYSGYIPYSTEYIYNTPEYAAQTGKNSKAPLIWGPGTYEANISPGAADTGSGMVAHMLGMLQAHNTKTKSAYCEHCQETVVWMPLDNNTVNWQMDGHYYLTENITEGRKIVVYQGMSLCLDLNGKTYDAKGMAFHTYSNGPELSIFDSSAAKTGKVIGHSRVGYSTADSTQYRGGTLVVSGGSTINIYGGTFSFKKLNDEEAVPVSQGGAVLVLGTLNMYGGKIIGADLEVTDWVNANDQLPGDNGFGAAVYVGDRAKLNISGGTITAGTVPTTGQGRCVYLAGMYSAIDISGDAVIEEVMLRNITNRSQLKVTGEFTGSAAVALAQEIAYAGDSIANGLGYHENAVIYATAMPIVKYAEGDPNTPVDSGLVLTPDETPDETYDNKTLLRVRRPRVWNCEACGESANWWPIYNTTRIPSNTSGHYFLLENINTDNAKKIVAERDQKICLDLNNMTYEVNDTAIHPYQYATVSVTDHSTKKQGQIISHPGTQTTGGVIMISANASVNIYSGTYSYVPGEGQTSGVVSGGAAYINSNGTLNVYGGKLIGADLVNPGNTGVSTPGLGGAVTVLYGGKLKVAGGQIVSGSTPTGKAACVYLAARGSRVELTGNGSVEELFANWSDPDMITVTGAYTGQTELYFNTTNAPLSNGLDIGNSADASFAVANLWIANSSDYGIKVSGNNLLLSTDKKVEIYTSETDTAPTTYQSLADALSVYEGGIIRLLDNVDGDVTINKDAVLDLNGKSINGTVTVAKGKTLYGADLSTDDYDIEDGIYGKIQAVSGNVVGLSTRVDGTKDYLKITESDGVSFHRVNLTLTYVTLTPESASVKYKSEFEGDRLVAENVKQFGIAFNLTEAPDATNLTPGTYSKFTGFQAGEGKNGTSAGTSVVNIMKEDKTEYENGLNAKRAIYGSAYILTKDGEYLFGQVESRSFRDVVAGTNDYWNNLNQTQKDAVVAMYKRFEGNMKYWGLDKIMAAAQ